MEKGHEEHEEHEEHQKHRSALRALKNALIRGSPTFSQAYLLFVNRDRAFVKLDISSFIQLITIQARTISNQVLNRPPHCAIMFLLTRKTF